MEVLVANKKSQTQCEREGVVGDALLYASDQASKRQNRFNIRKKHMDGRVIFRKNGDYALRLHHCTYSHANLYWSN